MVSEKPDHVSSVIQIFRNCVTKTINRGERLLAHLVKLPLALQLRNLLPAYSARPLPLPSRQPRVLADLGQILQQTRAPVRLVPSANLRRVHQHSLRQVGACLVGVHSAGSSSSNSNHNNKIAHLVVSGSSSSSNLNQPREAYLVTLSAIKPSSLNHSVHLVRVLFSVHRCCLISRVGTANTTGAFGGTTNTFGQTNAQQPATTGTGLFSQQPAQSQPSTNAFSSFGTLFRIIGVWSVLSYPQAQIQMLRSHPCSTSLLSRQIPSVALEHSLNKINLASRVLKTPEGCLVLAAPYLAKVPNNNNRRRQVPDVSLHLHCLSGSTFLNFICSFWPNDRTALDRYQFVWQCYLVIREQLQSTAATAAAAAATTATTTDLWIFLISSEQTCYHHS